MGRLLNILAYAAALLAIVFGLFGQLDRDRQETTQVRRPPAQRPAPLQPSGPLVVVEAQEKQNSSGTAFAVADGWWLTARHVADHCEVLGLLTAPQRGVRVKRVFLHTDADLALLYAGVEPQALPLQGAAPAVGSDGFALGYPQGRPGEVYARLIGAVRLRTTGRFHSEAAALRWTQVQRVPADLRALGGLSGGPMLDDRGRVVGVLVAASRRRGRVTTAHPGSIAWLLAEHGVTPSAGPATGPALSLATYSREADRLRKDLTIAKVYCKARRPVRRPRF